MYSKLFLVINTALIGVVRKLSSQAIIFLAFMGCLIHWLFVRAANQRCDSTLYTDTLRAWIIVNAGAVNFTTGKYFTKILFFT